MVHVDPMVGSGDPMDGSGGTHHLSICMDPRWSTHPLALCMALSSSCIEMSLWSSCIECGAYLSTGTQLADVVMLVGTVDVVFGSVDL